MPFRPNESANANSDRATGHSEFIFSRWSNAPVKKGKSTRVVRAEGAGPAAASQSAALFTPVEPVDGSAIDMSRRFSVDENERSHSATHLGRSKTTTKSVIDTSTSQGSWHLEGEEVVSIRTSDRIAEVLDSRLFLLASVLITIYALIGEDIRLLCTSKPSDNAFNVMCILCAAFFCMEIVLSCVAKHDYFMGFFFMLDVISTASLVLDLTWVSDYLAEEQLAEEGADRARGGRTARLGASVGRVIRVLRLVRIMKLYKVFFEHREPKPVRKTNSLSSCTKKSSTTSLRSDDSSGRVGRHSDEGRSGRNSAELKKQRQRGAMAVVPGKDQEDEEEDAEDETNTPAGSESLVSKMLVALTTRRVIIMVLAMLLVLPNLGVDDGQIVPMSAWWGADGVWTAWRESNSSSRSRAVYETRMLKYLYYHNWFAGNWGCDSGDRRSCPADYYAHVFWVGLAGQNTTMLDWARLDYQVVTDFNHNVQGSDFLFDMGQMPATVQRALSLPWAETCSFANLDHRGVSLLAQEIPAGHGDPGISYPVKCPDDLRPQEKLRVYPLAEIGPSELHAAHFVAFFDLRPYTREEASMSMLTTLFVCCALCIGSLVFAKDANEFVLRPVETMIAKVNAIRDDPLIAIQMADKEFEKQEWKRHNKKRGRAVLRRKRSVIQEYLWRWAKDLRDFIERLAQRNEAKRQESKSRDEQLMETAILERTIIKLGSLLALGFGEAGAKIVAHNLRGKDTAGINTMIPGERVECIIGSARVRHFKYCTEVLQAKIMTFVNTIAEIVHGCVNECHGAANKNNGDTFLIIWRLTGTWFNARRLADLSILSFSRITGAVEKSPLLLRYREHPGLQQRLHGDSQVRLCFGLHFGWAIEGAVGSDYKIDASYLSPNVRIAEALEHSTKEYGVSLIVSEPVVQLCTEGMASKCRLIDKVLITGSKTPLTLHCVDLQRNPRQRETARQASQANRRVVIDKRAAPLAWNVRERFKARQILEVEKCRLLAQEVDISEEFMYDEDVSGMREAFTEEFYQTFNMGYQNYAEGEWHVARVLLMRTLNMLGFQDGPSGALLSFMDTPHDFQAPDGWRGVRKLND